MRIKRLLLVLLVSLALVTPALGAGVWSSNHISYKPQLTTQGTTDWTNFNTSQDLVDSLLGKLQVQTNAEIWVGQSGPTATSYDTLAHCITTIGSTKATLVVPPGTHVGDGLTVPATTTLRILQGANVTVANGATFTINNLDPSTGFYQLFTCTGTGQVTFGTGAIVEAYPQWFGAKGDGAANDTVAVQKAIASYSRVYCPAGDYLVNADSIDLANCAQGYFYGAGRGLTFFRAATAGTMVIGSTSSVNHLRFGYLAAVTNDLTTYGILFSGGFTSPRIDQTAAYRFWPDAQHSGGISYAVPLSTDKGTGYTVADVLTVGGGSGTVTVATVDGSGAVQTVTVTTPGSGYNTNDHLATTGGTGTGCKIAVVTITGTGRGFGLIKTVGGTGTYYGSYYDVKCGTISAPFEYGIYMDGATANFVNGNRFYNTQSNGCSGAAIYSNYAQGNYFYGVSAENCRYAFAYSNGYMLTAYGVYAEASQILNKGAGATGVFIAGIRSPGDPTLYGPGFTPGVGDFLSGDFNYWPAATLSGLLSATKSSGAAIISTFLTGESFPRVSLRPDDIAFGGGAAAVDTRWSRPSEGSIRVASVTTGESYGFYEAKTEVTSLTAGATHTIANLIPANATVFSVTCRVTELIDGPASFKVGVSGTLDAFGTGILVALNTTSNGISGTVLTPTRYAAATDVLLTATGGSGAFTGGAGKGKVRVVVTYFQPLAPTS